MDITRTSIWKKLERHASTMSRVRASALFAEDSTRQERLFLDAAGLQLDYSRNTINATTLDLLVQLAEKADLADRIQQMFDGAPVNTTENRAALHTLLRSSRQNEKLVNEAREVRSTLDRMETISSRIREGQWRGHSGKPIRHVIHLGIGGSWLGPRMVAEALSTTLDGDIRASWVANVDGQHIRRVLADSDPADTLLVVVSKTFTTAETMANAHTARDWLLQHIPESGLHRHLIGVTTNHDAARDLGIDNDNILPMWDWIGGRYSLWSAVGITNAIIHGMDAFREMLAGAEAMDEHFLNAPLKENMPVLLALIGIWHHNFFDFDSHAVITYDHALRLLPDHLQQLDMESNGKAVTEEGKPVHLKTGPIVWGGEGTNGQHAFHQLLHQGTRPVSLDFILPLRPNHDLQAHHDLLVANCLSQSQALMTGRQVADSPHKAMPGNRPSNLILMEQLTPRALGSLIALYEHKVFTQARIWQINPFDQWGVELGKELARDIHNKITGTDGEIHPDPVTQRLIERYKIFR